MSSVEEDPPVCVWGFMRTVRKGGVAIWTGAYAPNGDEVWDWLPRSKITWVYWSGRDDKKVTVTMPESIARDKCLAWRPAPKGCLKKKREAA